MQQEVEELGGELIYGPAGGIIRVTVEGQRVGRELLIIEREKQAKQGMRLNLA